MNILGLESSCDETSAAVVRDGAAVLSNVIASQVEVHARYGGIVPEVASRQHLLQIIPIIRRAMGQAHVEWRNIDAIAVTSGPGLAGALLVGVNAAKAISLARGLPLVGINHIEAHIYANWLEAGNKEEGTRNKSEPQTPNLVPRSSFLVPAFPALCLIVSGGHTDLMLMRDHGAYELLGSTRDDAAGEAFDKVARVLGLGYPGGPLIQKIAEEATEPVRLPRAWLKGTHDFSFSGLKTAVLHMAQEQRLYPPAPQPPRPRVPELGEGWGEGPRPEDSQERRRLVANIAAGFQEAVVDVLVEKTVEAAAEREARCIVLAGGVAANRPLRERLKARSPLPVHIPSPIMCTDNAAMIACCGYHHLQRGHTSGLDLDVLPNWRIAPAAARS